MAVLVLTLVAAIATVGGTFMWQGLWAAVAAGGLVFFLYAQTSVLDETLVSLRERGRPFGLD